jgi:Helix-turn-helix domain
MSVRSSARGPVEIPGRFVRPADVAAAYRVPLYKVWRWCRAGRLPAKQIGREWFVDRKCIDGLEGWGEARP